jgi:hypothetical protein
MKKLIASLVVGLVGLNPGLAHATEVTDQAINEHGVLLNVVEKLGIPVIFDGQLCRDRPTWYGGYEVHGRSLVLCNRGDQAEKLNTMRHEAFHVYQDLKDCSIRDSGLSPAFSSGATPRFYKEFAAKYYEPGDVQLEAEAFWAADTFSAMTIATLLVQKGEECGYKFKF